MIVEFFNVDYFSRGRPILSDINYSIGKGEFYYIVGSNGAGKSTILQLIYMQKKSQNGSVLVGDYNSATIKRRHIPKLRRNVGIIFQDFKLLEEKNIYENIAFPLRISGFHGKEIRIRVFRALSDVGLHHRRYDFPHQLSGGEKQRAAIARALVNSPLIILADEPTGNLDWVVAEEIVELLEEINKKGTAVLMATHNKELITGHPHKTIFLEEGKILDVKDPFQKEPY